MWSPSSPGGAELVPAGRNKSTHPSATLTAMSALLCALGARGARAEVEFETVVTAPADPDSKPREDEAAAASVVTRDRTPRSVETLPQLLSELPGVSVTRFGALGSLGMISV